MLNYKIPLIITGFSVGSFEDFGSLEKGCLNRDSNGFPLARAKNQRESWN